MIAQQLYVRLDAIETELLAIEREIPFGQDPDQKIIAVIHVCLAADLPGLISRIDPPLTMDSYHLTLKNLDQFERNLAVCDFEGTTWESQYRELELRTRELFADVLETYTNAGIGKS
ncbi:MAG TPA: hypothetical protein PKK17_04855 [Sphingorhabdus lacus]|jgi:hypothetical protein|nr:hypothetical protein [Sphingorhabdus lacus]HPV68308.1 hypothetical protein [Sphingorhabdus lacus]